MTQASGNGRGEEKELQLLYCAFTGPIHFEAMDPAHSDAWRRAEAAEASGTAGDDPPVLGVDDASGEPALIRAAMPAIPIADEYGGVLERLAGGRPLRCTVCGQWIYRGRYVTGSPS